jgi:hypothetical protein
MSKLITIPAEGLKWCPVGFEFIYGSFTLEYGGHYPGRIMLGNSGGCLWTEIVESVKVQVNAKEYEEACVERIKEMFKDIYTIYKADGLVSVYASGINGEHYSGKLLEVPIKCDPRPHEETYEIEVNND